MDLLSSTSIVAAFIAGTAALFAPCCLTVLLPSYIGSVFKERYKVLFMTFVFFLGILTVFLPIGLGASALGQVFNRYHNLIFTVGGLLLVVLGIFLLLGKSLSIRAPAGPNIKQYNVWSVFVLGIFSAIATTCCAPVLAGVLALSMASGSVLWGGIYTLSYVLGMVMPLFFLAALLDKTDFTKKSTAIRKPRSITLFGYEWRFIISELTVGLVFLGMGLYIIYSALTNRLAMRSDYLLSMNIFLARLTHLVHNYTKYLPEPLWAALVLLIFSLLVFYIIKQFKKHD